MATSAICHEGITTLGQPQGEDNGTKAKSDLRVPWERNKKNCTHGFDNLLLVFTNSFLGEPSPMS
jgi:hypothetical protein